MICKAGALYFMTTIRTDKVLNFFLKFFSLVHK